ncbi:MAG: hypothetical protein ABI743_08665 [bacterium]
MTNAGNQTRTDFSPKGTSFVYRLSAFVVLMGAIGVLVSCSQSGPSLPAPAPQPTIPAATFDATPPLGIYRLSGDLDAGTLALTPLDRAGTGMGDNFGVDITALSRTFFRLKRIERPDPQTLQLTFSFTHPLPNTSQRTDLHVFDVRLHFLSSTVKQTFNGPGGLTCATGPNGAIEPVTLADPGLRTADGWSTWGDEVVEPATTPLAPNTYPYLRVNTDLGRAPFNAASPAGWNVVPMGPTEYLTTADFDLSPGKQINLLIALEASYGQSAKGPAQVVPTDPGGRLNPRYFVPEFNIKEAWQALVDVEGLPTIGDGSSSVHFDLEVYDHQGALPASGAFDPLTAPQNSLRYASSLSSATISLPGGLANAIALPGSIFTGNGTPNTPYHTSFDLTGESFSGEGGDLTGMIAFRDSLCDAAGSTNPLATGGYTRDNTVVARHDFTTYIPFTVTVDIDRTNIAPVADLALAPTTIASGELVHLSPGPGTTDADGAITLYEYDFDYDGLAFDVDAGNATGVAVDSPALSNLGTAPIQRTMALRVTDDATPALRNIDTATVTILPANRPPTAEVIANPDTVMAGESVQLSPGPATADPDGSIVLYEYDFDYTASTFTVDDTKVTGLPVTSPPMINPGAVAITRTMAMRVTDDGAPTKSTVDTVDVTINPIPPNQPPVADLVAIPTTVNNNGTTQLSPGPLTGDPDGSITFYEYDFDYVGPVFAGDFSNTTGVAVTSPALNNPGTAPLQRTMATRVTDNGAPGLTGLDIVVITINPPPPNQPPTAVLGAAPTTVDSGGTTQLSPAAGTLDPDGAIVLFEYDFDYQAPTFTADASNNTGLPMVSSTLTNTSGSAVNRTMALRVSDNGVPVLTAIATKAITINPVPPAPTWTEIYNLIVNGDPLVTGDKKCVNCHDTGEGGLTLFADPATDYANLVGPINTCNNITPYVLPGDHAGSYLWQALNELTGCADGPMPNEGPTWDPITIKKVADWIDAGALNN